MQLNYFNAITCNWLFFPFLSYQRLNICTKRNGDPVTARRRNCCYISQGKERESGALPNKKNHQQANVLVRVPLRTPFSSASLPTRCPPRNVLNFTRSWLIFMRDRAIIGILPFSHRLIKYLKFLPLYRAIICFLRAQRNINVREHCPKHASNLANTAFYRV